MRVRVRTEQVARPFDEGVCPAPRVEVGDVGGVASGVGGAASNLGDVKSGVGNLWRRRAAFLLMLASGFAGLGYQVVWTQQTALWLGHESAGVLAVVTAFFGGLAVGALALGSRIERSARPVRWYAGCELAIALWSCVLAFAMAPVSTWLLRVTGVQPSALWQWTVAFCGTFLLLLPATAAMGATLPAMERVTAELRCEGRSIAALYASNTFGAVIGVLAIAFWLAPELGLVRTAGVCVALNVLCAVASLSLFAGRDAHTAESHSTDATESRGAGACSADACAVDARATAGGAHRGSIGAREAARGTDAGLVDTRVAGRGANANLVDAHTVAGGALGRLALTGLLGIGYEVLVVRVLSQVEEDTVYTFAMLLAVYLVGSAAGAAAYQRCLANPRATREVSGAPRLDQSDRLRDWLLCALAAACLVGTASLWGAEHVKALTVQVFGASMSAALGAEALLALTAFAPPTIVMGALFSLLSAQAMSSGVAFGRALGVNTIGAALAPLVFGVLAFPFLGPKLSLVTIALGYLALTSWRTWSRPAVWLSATAAAALAVFAPRLAFIDVPDGGHVVSYQEGVMAAVSVVEDAQGVARLRIDNRQQEGSSATLRVDSRQALLPVLLHPAPKRALFLGLGTGMTASSAAQDPTLHVDAVELLPEVIVASAYFTRVFNDDTRNARLRLVASDARRYVRASNQLYDVIVSDNFHPARSGSGSLYTVEHFAAVRDRLASGGVFCQWLPLHQLDLQTLRSIVQSFLAVYPNGWAMLASNSLETPVLGLVGRNSYDGDARFDVGALRARLSSIELPDNLAHVGIEDELALLGSFVAGPSALNRFAGSAPANTDDHPVVAYLAPRITYAPDSLPRDRLIALLHELSIEPAELIDPTAESAWASRLAAYWTARNLFIESGRNVRPSADVHEMLAQVRAPLLAVLRISPDFRPAYDPLLFMAAALGPTDAPAARTLLSDLMSIQPARPEAALALREIGTR